MRHLRGVHRAQLAACLLFGVAWFAAHQFQREVRNELLTLRDDIETVRNGDLTSRRFVRLIEAVPNPEYDMARRIARETTVRVRIALPRGEVQRETPLPDAEAPLRALRDSIDKQRWTIAQIESLYDAENELHDWVSRRTRNHARLEALVNHFARMRQMSGTDRDRLLQPVIRVTTVGGAPEAGQRDVEVALMAGAAGRACQRRSYSSEVTIEPETWPEVCTITKQFTFVGVPVTKRHVTMRAQFTDRYPLLTAHSETFDYLPIPDALDFVSNKRNLSQAHQSIPLFGSSMSVMSVLPLAGMAAVLCTIYSLLLCQIAMATARDSISKTLPEDYKRGDNWLPFTSTKVGAVAAMILFCITPGLLAILGKNSLLGALPGSWSLAALLAVEALIIGDGISLLKMNSQI